MFRMVEHREKNDAVLKIYSFILEGNLAGDGHVKKLAGVECRNWCCFDSPLLFDLING